MARTRWPSDLGTPASSPGKADQTGTTGGCHKNLGPGRQIVSQDSTPASAESEVRPGPRTPDPTPPPSHRPGNRGQKHYPHSPCRLGAAALLATCWSIRVQISL